MDKQEAQAHIGKRVSVHTFIRGEYEGVLIEVKTFPGKPWRGLINIDKIVAPADPEGWTSGPYRTKEIGEHIEAGAVSIEPITIK